MLLAACSPARSNGFVRPEFFRADQRIAFTSDGPLSQALTTELGARGFRIVERAQLLAVLNEQALKQTGLLEEQRNIAAGRIMNVNYLVSVTETTPPRDPNVPLSAVVRILDVQTGEVVGSVNYTNRGPEFGGMPMMNAVTFGKEATDRVARRIAETIMDQRKS